MKVNAEKTAEGIAEYADRMTGPSNMDQKTALEVLELLIEQLEMRIECLKDEIADKAAAEEP